MRPVEKWAAPSRHIGSNGQLIDVDEDYPDYRSAKPILCENLGKYCSYCEDSEHKTGDLDVEHVQPKALLKYAKLETKWDNFLLGCRPCNEWVKKANDVVLDDVHLPHLNNTYKSLVYKKAGVVIVNPALSSPSKEHAENLIHLVGLDLGPYDKKDGGRCNMRSETWDMAEKTLQKYEKNKNNKDYVDSIIDLAKAQGGWSIWFTVFKGHDEVRRRLIKDFPGTAANCFDPNNNYEPIDRNPGKADPV